VMALPMKRSRGALGAPARWSRGPAGSTGT
jgi:hypothetical protein